LDYVDVAAVNQLMKIGNQINFLQVTKFFDTMQKL